MSIYGLDGPPELDPDIARLQAQAVGAEQQLASLPLPVAAFIASLNGLTGAVSLAGGTSNGVTITITPGVGTITISQTGIDPIATKKSNLSATVAPAVTDDSGDGYAIGSIWIDVTADDAYIALDVSVGASVWKKITP